MKRQKLYLFCFILIYSLSLLYKPHTAYATVADVGSWPEGPGVYAEGAIVVEASTGLILYSKNMDEQYYPASITKIMTALVAIENSTPGEIVTFSKNAVFGVDLNSSRIGIDVGEQLTMQQCLYAILLESANEVSYAVAEHVGGGDADVFFEMMNEKARSLGCKNTNFVNPHGLHDGNHYTSPYDMALITREAMKYDAFRKIFSTRTYKIPPTNIQKETRYLANHHKFILNRSYENCIGGKTGFTSVSRYTLVTTAKRGDLELICVVMRDDTSGHQYSDTTKLLDYGFDNFSIYPIADLEKSPVLKETPFFTRYNTLLNKTDGSITTDKEGYLVLPNSASFGDAIKEVSFFPAVNGYEENNVIGKISYTYNGKYVGGADILYHDVERPSLFHEESEKPEPTITPSGSVTEENKVSYRPVIIGLIVGLFALVIGLYFVLVERPRLKRRSAYYKKRALRKASFQDDDYLDL